jgi:DNA repair exonuclease SbcCD ATPase subunit
MKTVNFTKLTIQNFLSVGEEPVIIDFKRGLHVITDKNLDKPDRKNAVGKSTIADALYFAIFGETLREIKKELIINNITGGKAQVELEFHVESPRGNNKFQIIRTLTPTKVYVYKDGVDKTRDSIANTTKYICDVLSASQAVFQNCVIMTVNNAIPFMAKNKTEKRRFIEDIFGMEVFSKMISILRTEYNDIKREYDVQNTKLDEVVTSLSSHNLQKTRNLDKKREKRDLYLERQRNNSQEIADLNNQISQMTDSVDIANYKQQISDLEVKLSICEDKISSFIEESTTQKATLNHKKEHYTKIGTDESKCPVCLRSIEAHDKETIEHEKKKLKEELVHIAADVKILLTKVQESKDLKEKIKGLIQQTTRSLNNANLQLQLKKNLTDNIDKLVKWQEDLKVDIESLNNDTDEFDDLINTTEKRKDELTSLVSSISKQLSKLDIVKFIVSEEGVKSYIVNKLLELLNNKLYFYLKKLDSNSTCVFNEYFEEEIVNDKNKICSYFNFSGAERKSIDLACLFAFSDIRRLQGGVSYNIAIYDELFDSSFDAKGIEIITEILKERVDSLNECTIVISHRKESLKAVTGDIICLEKRDGITRRIEYLDEY